MPPSLAQSRRIVVFCGSPASASTVETLEALADRYPHWSVLVVQQVRRRPWTARTWRRRLARLVREPLGYPLELLGELAGRLSPTTRTVAGRVGLPGLSSLDRPHVQLLRVESLHDAATLQAVEQFDPWLGVCLGAPILREPLFSLPALGTINVHKSLLPDYRGMPPAFWELHDGAERTGVSVHWVSAGLDTGDLLGQADLPIPPYATVAGLAAQLDERACELLLDVLGRLDAGEVPRVAQGPARTPTRSRPPHRLRRRVERRLQRARRPGGSPVKRLVKWAVLAGYVHGWGRLRNLMHAVRGTAPVTVLLYHRVDDEHLDDVTVGVEQFGRQIALLKRHYDVLELGDWLAEPRRPRRRPAVVITFDDGYASAALAARLLRREGLAATFFISTRIVGTDEAFPHDRQKLGRAVRALSWEQVRQMQRWGFAIGNHTATHANLGRIDTGAALAEIQTAHADLRRRLGQTEAADWLAYPHGKPADITPAVREALAGLGVTCCLSAHGGLNGSAADRRDIRRQGVDWKYSLLALRAVLAGWQVRTPATVRPPAQAQTQADVA